MTKTHHEQSSNTETNRSAKLSDDAVDGIAILCIIAVIVTGLSYFLYSI